MIDLAHPLAVFGARLPWAQIEAEPHRSGGVLHARGANSFSIKLSALTCSRNNAASVSLNSHGFAVRHRPLKRQTENLELRHCVNRLSARSPLALATL